MGGLDAAAEQIPEAGVGGEPGAEGRAGAAVGVKDIAKAVEVDEKGEVAGVGAVDEAEAGLEGRDLPPGAQLGKREGVEGLGRVFAQGDGGQEGKGGGGLAPGGEEEGPGGGVAEQKVVGMDAEGIEVTRRKGGAIVPIAGGGGIDKTVGEGVVAGFMGKVREPEEAECALVLVGKHAWRSGQDEGNKPICGAEGWLRGGRGEVQCEEAEEGEQAAHQGSQGSIWPRLG